MKQLEPEQELDTLSDLSSITTETNKRKALTFKRALHTKSHHHHKDDHARVQQGQNKQRNELKERIKKMQSEIDALDQLMLSPNSSGFHTNRGDISPTKIRKREPINKSGTGSVNHLRDVGSSTMVVGTRTYMTKAELRLAIKDKIAWFQRNPGERIALKRKVEKKAQDKLKAQNGQYVKENKRKMGQRTKYVMMQERRAVSRRMTQRSKSALDKHERILHEQAQARRKVAAVEKSRFEAALARHEALKNQQTLDDESSLIVGPLGLGDSASTLGDRDRLSELKKARRGSFSHSDTSTDDDEESRF